MVVLKASESWYWKKAVFSCVPHTLPLGWRQQGPAGRWGGKFSCVVKWCGVFSRWQSFSESVQCQWWAWWQREAGREEKRGSKDFQSVPSCGPSANTWAWALVPWKEEGCSFWCGAVCLSGVLSWLCPPGSFCWKSVFGQPSSCPLYFWGQQGESEAFLGYLLLSEGLGLEAHF